MIDLRLGDCRTLLPTIPSGSVDCVITDPPYPEIDRDYGRLTEAEWWTLIVEGVIPEVRRVLKPTGSAVFILQPNSREVGSMRGWLWEFMAWACREWNMVQDAWWWNPVTLPSGGAPIAGLLRPSLKACVWLGPPDCYRDQDAVLWSEGEYHRSERAIARAGLERMPSGRTVDVKRCFAAAVRRGGVTPYNLIPLSNGNAGDHQDAKGHPAATPFALCDWWIRYLSAPDDVVLDPFMGSGTVPFAAIRRNRSAIGFEQMSEYFEMAQARLDGPPTPLFDGIADLPAADETPLFSGATS